MFRIDYNITTNWWFWGGGEDLVQSLLQKEKTESILIHITVFYNVIHYNLADSIEGKDIDTIK